jgi:hypothetical protein
VTYANELDDDVFDDEVDLDESRAPLMPHDPYGDALRSREQYPRVGGIQHLRRRLTGSPVSEPTDDLAMRADADKIAAELAAEPQPDLAPPHPGFRRLIARSERRTILRTRGPVAELTAAAATLAGAEAEVAERQGESAVAAAAFQQADQPPPRPRLGVALTSRLAVTLCAVVVLVPIEALLTYPQLQVLGMADYMTLAFAVLIGAAIVVFAEVLAVLVFQATREFHARRRQRGGGGLYWTLVALCGLMIVVGVGTLHRLAESRETNQAIVETRDNAAGAMEREITGDSGPVGDIARDRLEMDLAFTFWLQLAGALGAIGLGLRARAAEPYHHARRERRRLRREAALAQRASVRAEQRLAKSASAHERGRLLVRSVVEEERAALIELIERVRHGYRAQRGGRAPEVPVPPLPAVDAVVERIMASAVLEAAKPASSTAAADQPAATVPVAPEQPAQPLPPPEPVATRPERRFAREPEAPVTPPEPEPEPVIVSAAANGNGNGHTAVPVGRTIAVEPDRPPLRRSEPPAGGSSFKKFRDGLRAREAASRAAPPDVEPEPPSAPRKPLSHRDEPIDGPSTSDHDHRGSS